MLMLPTPIWVLNDTMAILTTSALLTWVGAFARRLPTISTGNHMKNAKDWNLFFFCCESNDG